MDYDSIKVTCKCKKSYRAIQSILQHITKSGCSTKYSAEEIESLQKQSNELSAAKKKIKDAERYKRKKNEISKRKAEKYQQEKAQIAEKYDSKKRAEKYQLEKEKYDPKRRAEKYQREKDKYDPKQRAEKYQRQKTELASKYDKLKRAKAYLRKRILISLNYHKRKKYKSYSKKLRHKKYKKIMASIAKKREQLKKNKQSKAGEFFLVLCYSILGNIYLHFKDMHYRIAYGQLNKMTYYNNAIDYVFEEELWKYNLPDYTYDCEFLNTVWEKSLSCIEWGNDTTYPGRSCILHMDESRLAEIIEKVMDEKCDEKTEKLMKIAAEEKVDREWKLVFQIDASSGFPATLSEFRERSCNKGFRTIFLQKYKAIYETAYDATLDRIMLSESNWDYDEGSINHFDHEKKMYRQLNCILPKELKCRETLVSGELAKIFKMDFDDTVKKIFLFFKDRIPKEVQSCNTSRKDWALSKALEIEKTFKNQDKIGKNFMRDAHTKIFDIYAEYFKRIHHVYENSKFEFKPFCFASMVDSYPDLGLNDMGSSSSCTSEDKNLRINDAYGIFIKDLWNELDIEKEKCFCGVCTSNLHWFNECKKVTWQKFHKMPYRTCPLCQLNIPKEKFDQQYENGHFISVSRTEITCVGMYRENIIPEEDSSSDTDEIESDGYKETSEEFQTDNENYEDVSESDSTKNE